MDGRALCHADVWAAEARISDLHDLARRVEAACGQPAGRLLREAADLVASAAEEMRRAASHDRGSSAPLVGQPGG